MKTKLSLTLILLLVAVSFLFPTSTHTQHNQPIADGTLRKIRVPILMYHYVGYLPADADNVRVNLTITPDLFQQHIDYLSRAEFSPISLYEISEALLHGAYLPPKPIVLTFDDGHIDHYTNVFPILRDFSYTGTFFIITQFADNNQPGYLNWNQIQEMADAGMSMQSHTKTHPDLRNRDHNFLVYQILGSIESLEHYTQNEITAFSYPAGRYDTAVLNLLDTTTIQTAVTTQFGMQHTTTDMLEMPRIRITNETGVAGLDYLLTPTDD